MPKTSRELAAELVIAQIHAQSIIKKDQVHTGSILPADSVCNLLKKYYDALESLGSKSE